MKDPGSSLNRLFRTFKQIQKKRQHNNKKLKKKSSSYLTRTIKKLDTEHLLKRTNNSTFAELVFVVRNTHCSVFECPQERERER